VDVSLRDLRFFLVVAEELHLTRAAQRLFISQPGLSRQIRALELQVQAPLFERRANGLVLTAAGQALVEHARRVIQTWEETQEAVANAASESSRTLLVALTISVGRGLLPAIATAFSARRPGHDITVRQVPLGGEAAALLEGRADVALCWLPLPHDAPLRSRVLVTEPRHIALPATHRLVAQAEVAMTDLLDEPFLALPESAGPVRDFWLATENRQGRPVRIGAVVHGPEEVIEALGRGIGVAFIAAGNAELFRRPEFTTRPVPGIPPGELAIVWRQEDCRPAVRDFVRCCSDAVSA
jgi:DNA-binding transcriptional LysR family regulator